MKIEKVFVQDIANGAVELIKAKGKRPPLRSFSNPGPPSPQDRQKEDIYHKERPSSSA
jgi:hypothetical protein